MYDISLSHLRLSKMINKAFIKFSKEKKEEIQYT